MDNDELFQLAARVTTVEQGHADLLNRIKPPSAHISFITMTPANTLADTRALAMECKEKINSILSLGMEQGVMS